MENLHYRIGLKNCLAVNGEGKDGGIALYWSEDITFDLLSLSNRYIDVHVSRGPFDHMWRATFIYGEPKAADRHSMWTKLRQIKPCSDQPWLMLGDFNEAVVRRTFFSYPETGAANARLP